MPHGGSQINIVDEHLDANRKLWDAWAVLHANSEFYDVKGFKDGEMRIDSIELEMGDVCGKSLLHLQCHFGLGTLSWAREGAITTGIDFSENAITIARQLSSETHLPSRFVKSNIYDLINNLEGSFDYVFTSYGVLNWLPDLVGWAKVIGHFCRPGGVFYIVEAHPFAMVFKDEGNPIDFQVSYPYFHQVEPFRFERHGSYADTKADVDGIEYGWNHSVSDILNSLIGSGMEIDYMREYPFAAWQMFPFLERHPGKAWWHLPSGFKSIPLTFALRATKR